MTVNNRVTADGVKASDDRRNTLPYKDLLSFCVSKIHSAIPNITKLLLCMFDSLAEEDSGLLLEEEGGSTSLDPGMSALAMLA